MQHIPILFENDDCIVFNKPAGLSVQGGSQVGISLDTILAARWSPRPLLVHRLDKDTSGLILVAKHREAAARCATLFSGRHLTKRYLAICARRPPAEAGCIRLNLAIRGVEKHAETQYTRVSGTSDFSCLALELGTGRMHQIRRHLAQTGNPILGDDKYGDFALNKELRKTRGLRRLLLHASRLVINEPALGLVLDITAPLPEYFHPWIVDSSNAQLNQLTQTPALPALL